MGSRGGSLPARLFAPDKVEIHDLDAWREHAGPAGAQARAWLQEGTPAMPGPIAEALAHYADADEVYARPAHPTALPDGECCDGVFACLRKAGTTTFVARIVAPAEGGADLDLRRIAQATVAEARLRDVDSCAVVIEGDEPPDLGAVAAEIEARVEQAPKLFLIRI
jgi:hypothetical protein